MKFFIVGLCSVFLLGCSLPSTKTDEGSATEKVIINDDRVLGSQPDAEVSTNDKRIEIMEVTIGAQSFTLEVSTTKAEREMGLMHREAMQYNEGMLFVFDAPARHRFWMKNTLIPLDILWLNKDKTIIHFETASPCYNDPCKIYGSTQMSKYVIELPAGSFVESVGTVVEF